MNNTETYTIAADYAEMSNDIIRDKCPDILAAGFSVGFLSCTKEKKRGKDQLILGECKKINDFEAVFCPYDFVIIIYDVNCEGMSDEQIKILLWHELKHIGIDGRGNGYVKPHDIEDFRDIIDKYGLDWAKKEA